jgi:endonuclease/exonuclease/phosphatase family metal-dependent hydrolase
VRDRDQASGHLRVATYNIHKCQGFDRRTSPERIISVLHELDADVLCLQEVVNALDQSPQFDQAGQIARAFPEPTDLCTVVPTAT